MRPLVLTSDPASANAALETWYIQHRLLDGLPWTLNHEWGTLRDAVVVYLDLVGADVAFIEGLKARGNRVVLFQMGDETGTKSRDHYALCDAVLRNYWFDAVFDDPRHAGRLLWMPNGFKSGVGPRDAAKLRPLNQRRFLAAFMGWVSNSESVGDERRRFQAQIDACRPHLYTNLSDGFSRGFNVGLYGAILESAVFCPCPAGNSAETIRLYDALESGAIPVSLRHRFLDAPGALGGVPFPLIDSWEDFPAFLEAQATLLRSEPQRLVDLQRRCIDWWQLRQHEIVGRVRRVLLELRAS